MDVTTLVRDPDYITRHLVVTDGGGVVTRRPTKIMIPERYAERHLASLGGETYILGLFGIIMDEKYYGVSFVNAMVRITPSSTTTVDVGGDAYLEFSFEPGDQVIYSLDLVKNDILTFYIYDEHVAKGRIPWYMNYLDLAYLFDSAKEHAGMNLGNRAVLELMLSTIARDSNNVGALYRHIMQGLTYVYQIPPKWIPFRSVIWNTSDTTSKLIGGYFSDAVTSALVNPSERVERIEGLLRT
jgi:hypothetical protein